MTTWTDDTLERRLAAALATVPAPDGVGRLDEHVQRAIAAETLRRGRSRRPVVRSGRRMLVLGVLVVTGALTAAAGGSTLLDRMMGNDGGRRTAWELAERLGLQATIDGDRVVLERAYLDANELMFGLSSADGLDPSIEVWVDGHTPEEWGVRSAGSGLNTGKNASAAIFEMSAPPDAGEVADVVVQVRRRGTPSIGDPSLERSGRFVFRLPNQGGGRMSGTATDTASGIRASLDRLVVTHASIEGHMTFELGDRAGPGPIASGWSSTGMELLHHGQRLDAGIGLGDDGSGPFNVVEGVDDWSGAWTIRVDGLTRAVEHRPGDEPGTSLEPGMEVIDGPWVFELTVPR